MARRVSRDNATLQFLPWLLVVALCGSLFATINFKKNENQVSSYSEFGSDPESIKAGLQSRLDAWVKSVKAAGVEVEPFLQPLQLPCSSSEKTTEPGGLTEPNEELRSHLSKVASDNEFMFVLANGVMICQNTTICWWNGGNILKSWLDVVTHKLKMTNFIVGVLDDETWKYMDSHYPNVHKFRPKMQIPSAQAGSHPANMVSTLKYGLLRQILERTAALCVKPVHPCPPSGASHISTTKPTRKTTPLLPEPHWAT
ncbi:hypothetical protein CYMTET_29832 [Cymbomonas tetramitiformis]|uniref:Uncharacterized protein n=1 Tax=Cymbomonas tetramitiformis TaxID=36881 RepID=A0AAE0FK82_9CHLO|nr:hypothetical protein CYMTET_29832 [Cymbomonas tetramitiformis]